MHTPCVYDSFLRLPPPLARVCSILLSPQGVVGERERNPQRLRCRGRCQQRADPQGRLGQLIHSRQCRTDLCSYLTHSSTASRLVLSGMSSTPGPDVQPAGRSDERVARSPTAVQRCLGLHDRLLLKQQSRSVVSLAYTRIARDRPCQVSSLAVERPLAEPHAYACIGGSRCYTSAFFPMPDQSFPA